METRRKITGKISIVGHRGALDCAPENTLASFREGLRQGADIIELDVQLTADAHTVILHDDLLDRTTDGRGPLADRTLAELKTLDAGSWFDARFVGEPIPTLEEVLIWAKNRVPLFVELKYGARFDPNLDGAVVQQIVAHKMLDQVMLISFEHQALRRVKEREPNMATGVLYRTPVADPVGLAREIGANAIMPLYHLIAADDVALSHQANLSVHAWGDGADYTALIATGVDCINANHPAQVRQKFLKGA